MQSSIAGNYLFQSYEEKPLDYFKVYLIDKDSNKVYDLRKSTVSISLDSLKTLNQRFALKIEKILPKITIVKNRVCLGDTAIFAVYQPNSMFKYQWILDGKESKADTLTTFKAIKSGKLALRQTYSDNNSDETVETDVIIFNLPSKPMLQRNVAMISAGKGYKGYKWYRDNQYITDSIRHSLGIVKNGSYFCVVSDSNKCINNSDTATLKKVEIEVIQNNMCPGEKAMAKVKSPETGFKYQWYIDGKLSQQDTNQTINLTQAAVLDLIMTHTGGYADSSSSQKITFRTLPNKPKLSETIGTMDAGNGYVSYQWHRNSKVLMADTSHIVHYPSSGVYYCIVKNADGCENYSDSLTIQKVAISTLINNPCNGDTAKFEVLKVKPGFRYQWELDGKSLKHDTSWKYSSLTKGTLRLIEFNTYGFRDTATSVKITVRPVPIVPIIVLANAGLNAGSGYYSYRWFRNLNALKTDTLQKLNLTDTGTYFCKVKNLEGCEAASLSFSVKGVAIKEIKNQVCAGDSTRFEILQPKSGFKYRWIFNNSSQPSDTGIRIHLKQSGSLKLVEYNSFGYKDTSKALYSTVNPLPKLPFIALKNAELTVDTGYTTYQWYLNGLIIAGAESANYPITKKGNYVCKVTNTHSCEIVSNTFKIEAASTFVIKNKVCQGDTAIFQIRDKKSGFVYTWLLDGMPVSATNDSQFHSIKSGELRLKETNSYGYSEITDTVNAEIKPLPIAPDLVFQNGTLDAGASFDLYKWFKNGNEISGKNSRFMAPGGPAEYYAGIGLNGCFANSNTIQFHKVRVLMTDSSFCEGESTDLEIAEHDTNFRYQWLNNGSAISNETSKTYTALESGNIQVVQWHPAGYTDTSTQKSVVENSLPLKPLLSRNQQVLNAGGPYSTYQWYYNNQPLNGETKQTLTLTMLGLYSCKVGNPFDCHAYSDTLNIQSLALRDISRHSTIKIAPNPTGDESFISITGSGLSEITLTDMQGKFLLNFNGFLMENVPLGLSNLPAGMYMVTVKNEGSLVHFRVIKQ